MNTKIGIIGGSGLYQLEGVTDITTKRIKTPFGDPSDALICGKLEGVDVVFLARHGKGHRFMPSEVNYRANIFAMKKLGVTHIISISAVGSMKEEHQPGTMVLVDQFFDNTKNRISTFFGNGIVGHVALAEPVCKDLIETIYASAKTLNLPVKKGGTYICIEGPQFSTKGESHIYRQWGVDVIGMTAMPEVKLAREAGICYATVALVTDYDCWHESAESVTVEMVISVLNSNLANAKKLLKHVITNIKNTPCLTHCKDALKHAIITAPEAISGKTKKNLAFLLQNE